MVNGGHGSQHDFGSMVLAVFLKKLDIPPPYSYERGRGIALDAVNEDSTYHFGPENIGNFNSCHDVMQKTIAHKPNLELNWGTRKWMG